MARAAASGWPAAFFARGVDVSGGSLVLGVAAIGTGNNLLFLLLGAMLGFITLSGWLSEQMLRGWRCAAAPPARITAGEPARVTYELATASAASPPSPWRWARRGRPARAWIPAWSPAADGRGAGEREWERRGVYPLETVTLATSFPFGLFRKERDVELPRRGVVWPRADRPVREPRPGASAPAPPGERPAGPAGARGEFRALRPFRPGDDPRDVHWRTTARAGASRGARVRARPLARALALPGAARGGGRRAEAAVETPPRWPPPPRAAATPSAWRRRTRACARRGERQLERVLDALARARFRADAPRPPAARAPRRSACG
jgi:uncharacterized protein (DUF58 family)